MTGFYSTFRPTVTVHDDGLIEIDWSDSYEDSYDGDEHQSMQGPEASACGAVHSAMLDQALDVGAGNGQTMLLRNLADWIESHQRPNEQGAEQ